MADWYSREIIGPGKQPLAVLFLAFVITFLFIRLSVRMIRAEVKWWPGNVTPGGMHLHHMVFGTIAIMIAGVGGFSPIGDRRPWEEIFAGLFGIGAALVLDEFALILHLRDVYWSAQGRTSVNAIFLATALMGLLLTGGAPLGAEAFGEAGVSGLFWAIVPNAVFVTITLIKGKIWTGLIGIMLPVIAVVGTFRLARPTSPWARWRYHDGTKKQARAQRREDRGHARWARLRTRVQDAVAGRPTS